MDRVGPYQLGAERVAAGGARFFEGSSGDGERVLLEIVRLRHAKDDEERAQRHRCERTVAARTAALIDEPSLGVRAHAGVDTDSGRILYWAFAWRGEPLKGTLPHSEWIALARALLERLATRHARGRLDARMDPALVVRTADGFDLLGMPIDIDASWLDDTGTGIRRAPEEVKELGPAGDLWRLGRVLAAFSPALDRAETELLESLTASDPAARPKSALEAIARLRAIEIERTEASDRPGADWGQAVDDPEHTPTGAVPSVKAPIGEEATQRARAPDEQSTTRIPLPRGTTEPSGPAAAQGQEARRAVHEGDTLLFEPDREPRAEAITKELRPARVSSVTGEILAVDPSEARTSLDSYSPLASDPAALPTDHGARRSIVEVLPTPKVVEPHSGTLNAPQAPDAAHVEAASVAWTPAMLPEGASPWSEVIKPRVAGRRHTGEFKGFDGELPPMVVEQTLLEQRITLPPPPGSDKERPEAGGPSPTAINPRRIVLGVVATLVVFGLFALASRTRPQPIEALEGLVATPVNEVFVDARPGGATVIAEHDGQILGRTPLRFLVPPGAEATVLLSAPGYEPQRLILPERGRLVAEMAALPSKPCEIEIEGTRGFELEGVGVELGSGPSYRIPGSAVVRLKDPARAQQYGARVVRCPEVNGGHPRVRFVQAWTPASVRVTHPPGASAELNGSALGVLPATKTTERAFSLVRVVDRDGRSIERWVPTVTDVEVQMPEPQAQHVQVTARDDEVELASAPAIAGQAALLDRGPAEESISRSAELARRANRQMLEGQGGDATKTLKDCVATDPAAAECHRLLGSILRRQSEHRAAAVHFARYLELAPEAPDAPLIRSILRQWQ